MKIVIIGAGYVGMTTSVAFAEYGHQVIVVEHDKKKIEMLTKGHLPFYEKGMEEMMKRQMNIGKLSFTASLKESLNHAEYVFITVGTPSLDTGEADLSFVEQVGESIGRFIQGYKTIILKSTVPVGTAEKVRAKIAANCKVEFDVISNPEFLREGVAVEDFMKPDRVVIGTRSEKAKKITEALYAPFVRQGNPIIFMDERSAELTKYAANSFLAAKITFMNEIANLCELLGADVDAVRKGIGTDSRIGKRFLFAGIGYGGSCFPKDVQALAKSSEDAKYDFKMLKAVMDVNQTQKTKLIPALKKYFGGNLKNKTIAIWGLSFKPHTDDIREAPALYNIEELLREGATVKAHDPESMENVKKIFGERIQYSVTPYQAAEGADALLIATEWPEFRTPDFDKLSSLLKSKVIFDGRNLYELQSMRELGYTYFSIGREVVNG